MAYDFSTMTPDELRAALNGPTGDVFARRIANAAIDGMELHQTLLKREEDINKGTFGWVLEGMQETGARYRRAGWNGKGMFIFLVPGSPELTVDEGRPLAEAGVPVGTKFSYLPHIDMWTAQGDVVPWLASQADMLATDWEEV